MNWLTNFVRPKIQALIHPSKKEIPDNLWHKCLSCEQMVFQEDFLKNLYVCHHCNHHERITPQKRFEQLFDNGEHHTIRLNEVMIDPLHFKDTKRYRDRMRDYQEKTRQIDALSVAEGKIDGFSLVIAAFNFSFMGGSMGMYVGQGLVEAAKHAIARKIPLLVIPCSGGARMQEGILSLMQMPRSVCAVEMMKDAKLPYWVLLADPTTGGVAASFAMLGDITFAEPRAVVGFAGRRVIEETIREKLPDEFQTAEYLLDHGMIDQIVERKRLREVFGRLLSLTQVPIASS